MCQKQTHAVQQLGDSYGTSGDFRVRRIARNCAAVWRNSTSSSLGSTPSPSITALTMESASVASKRGSRWRWLMQFSLHRRRRGHSAMIRIGSVFLLVSASGEVARLSIE